MTKCFGLFGSSSRAKVVDGRTLVLSLLDALTPVVWKMDLGEAQASALEVKEIQQGGFALSLRTQKGEATEIARYATKAQVVKALSSVTKALESAKHLPSPAMPAAGQGMIPPYYVPPHRGGFLRGLFLFVLGVICIVGLLFLIAVIGFVPPQSIPNGASYGDPAMGYSSNGPAPEQADGVPMSADDFLLQQR